MNTSKEQYINYLNNFESFEQELSFGGKPIFLNGLCGQYQGQMAIGSSVSFDKNHSLISSNWELLERMSVIDHASDKNIQKTTSSITYKGQCKPAISNGVAIYSDKNQALENSFLEFWERESILKSWYFGHTPKEVSNYKKLGSHESISAIENESLELSVYSFKNNAGVYVFGSFAEDLKKQNTIYYGFGAARSKELALEKSIRELIQRYMFLKDEDFSTPLPENTMNASFNQEFFMRKKGYDLLKKWLSNNLPYITDQRTEKNLKEKFTFLTPNWLKDGVVCKTYSEDAIPLLFGEVTQLWNQKLVQDLRIHPIV